MKQIIITNIPDDIHIKFKTWCAKNGKTMRDALIKFIKEIKN